MKIPTKLILFCALLSTQMLYAQKLNTQYYVKGTTTPVLFVDQSKDVGQNISLQFEITPQNSSAQVGALLRYNGPEDWLYVGCDNPTDYLGFAHWVVATPKDTVVVAHDIAKLYAHYKRNVRIDCEDRNVTIYVDGEQVVHTHLPKLTPRGGAIGFRAHGNGEAIITNVKYTPLIAPKPMQGAKTQTITSDDLAVSLYRDFPSVAQYTILGSGTTIRGWAEVLPYLCINGDLYMAKVKSQFTKGKAKYTMQVDPLDMEIRMECAIEQGGVLNMRVTEIIERGATKLQTLALPDHNLVSVDNNEAGATLSVADRVNRDFFYTLKGRADDPTRRYGTIVALNTDKWAATLESNSIYNTRAFLYRTKGGRTSIWGNEWIYRGLDGSIVALPYIKVVLAGNNNADNKIDWQDALIALQRIYPAPMGADWIRNSYATITMNFASFAQYPFLRQLDNIKKFYLATDGFGQMLELKGYQSEGHDSGHPDYGGKYNKRAGGQSELALLAREAKKYNALIGVHINHSESYPEASAFNDTIVTDIPGWAWLDQAYLINKEADVLCGGFNRRLEALHNEIPDLSFIYIDTYREYRWLAYNTAREFNSRGWAVWTEDADVFDRESCWIHYTPESKSLISRFLHHKFKDGYAKHLALSGGYSHSAEIGFMGWQKGRDFNGVLSRFYTEQLPLRYLMHFPVLELDSVSAKLEGGIGSYSEDGKLTILKNSKPVMRGGVVFIPWDPTTEQKIYHYNPTGGVTTWQLPDSWSGLNRVYTYELSATGRGAAKAIEVVNNSVTLDATPATGYVLYKNEQPTQEPMEWSTGSPVSDMGFDSGRLGTSWRVDSGNPQIDQTPYGQSYLAIKGTGAVSQSIAQPLEAGAKYVASVWVNTKAGGTAKLGVKVGAAAEQSSSVNHSTAINLTDNTDRYNTTYQRLKLGFTAPVSGEKVTITLSGASSCDSS